MSQSQPADPLPALVQDADRLTLNQRVHRDVMRKLVFSQEEMQAEAETVWKTQPDCRCFLAGFSAIDHRIIGGLWRFEQQMPRYSFDWCAIRLVEDEIERRGLLREYVVALDDLMGSSDDSRWTTRDMIRLLRASCEARCRAALAVCGATP